MYQAGLVGCEEGSLSPTLHFPLNTCPLPLNGNRLEVTTFLATFMVSLKAHHQLCPVPFRFSSVVQLSLTLCDPMIVAFQAPLSMEFSRQELTILFHSGMGNHSVLQGIFPTQGLNPGFLHCRQILYQLSHEGSPSVIIGTIK